MPVQNNKRITLINHSVPIYKIIAVKRDIQIVPKTLHLSRVPYK